MSVTICDVSKLKVLQKASYWTKVTAIISTHVECFCLQNIMHMNIQN